MNCFFCKGTMKEDFTTHVAELKNCIVIIKHVPCMKCNQCGETVYSGDVLKQLDRIGNKPYGSRNRQLSW